MIGMQGGGRGSTELWRATGQHFGVVENTSGQSLTLQLAGYISRCYEDSAKKGKGKVRQVCQSKGGFDRSMFLLVLAVWWG